MLVQSPSPGCQAHVLEHPQLSPVPSPGDSPSKPAWHSVPSPWPLLSATPSVCVLPSLLPCLEWEGRGRAAGAAVPSAVALPAGGDAVRDCQLLRTVPMAHWRKPPSPVPLLPKPQGKLQATPCHQAKAGNGAGASIYLCCPGSCPRPTGHSGQPLASSGQQRRRRQRARTWLAAGSPGGLCWGPSVSAAAGP